MVQTTSVYGIRYREDGDSPDIPETSQFLAEDVEDTLQGNLTLGGDLTVPGTLTVAGVATFGADPWHAVSFSAPWVNQGSGFGNCGYRKTGDGMVQLTGMCKLSAGTVTANTTIFTLPVGYRPAATRNYIVSNNPASTVAPTPRGIQIATDGTVKVVHFAGTIDPGSINLDQISFALTTGI